MQKSNINRSLIALAVAQSFMINADAATISLNGNCSLRDAIQSANTDLSVNGCPAGSGDDTIAMLASSTVTLTAVDPAGEMVAGLPPVTSNISIQGNGSTITRDVTAPGFRIFTVTNNATFEIDNVTLTNGVGTGAAIQATDAELVRITNSTISNHSAGMVNGSSSNSNIGINLQGTDLELSGSVVTQNNGTNNVGVFVDTGTATITQSQITYNTASISTAGLYVAYGEVTMNEAVVSNNSASSSSGANFYSPSAVSVTQSQIIANMGTDSGLYVYQRSSFGALSLNVSNTQVNQNQGDHSGFYVYAESPSEASTATFNGVTVNQNISDTSAGLELIGELLTVTAADIDVMQNQGGNNQFSGISISGGATVNLENLELANNTPKTGASTNRSGLTVNGSNLTLANSIVSSNSAQRVASAVFMSNSSNVEITNTQILNNAMLDGDSGIHAPVHVDDSTLTLTNVTLDGNTSVRNGGAIHADNGSSVTINSSTLSNNLSPSAYGGGALYLGYGTDTTISNSTLSGNRSGDGSAIKSVDSNTLTLTNVTMTNHDSAAPESSVFTLSISGIQSQLSINNSLLSGNNGDLCNSLLPGGVGTNNWFEDGTCFGFGQGLAQLGPLEDNGGLTKTHAISIGSPLIDAANPSICASLPIGGKDQRGNDRDNLCDIGAYEYIDDTSFFIFRAKNGNTIVVPL